MKNRSKHRNISLLRLLAAGAVVLLIILLLNDPHGLVSGFLYKLK